MDDEKWMEVALSEAGRAAQAGEVPVGAVIVYENELISCGHNLTETLQDPTAHAELIAIRLAADKLQVKWLEGCYLYVTLEPCAMCAGAMILARMKKLLFGAFDPKHGSCGSLENIVNDKRRNHRIEVVSGLMSDQSQRLLQDFFKAKR